MAGKPLILCVDDASNELEGRKMLLEENGFEVLTASNGIEALQAFVSHPVDLVLLDYHMPQMNGDVAAEHMKACKPDVPVALLSADDRVPQSKLKTVDVFVSKSEPITTFLAIVDHLLSLRFLFQPLGDLETGEDRGAACMFPSGHRESEENIEASGLPYTFLRPNGFMQNLVNYDAGTIRSQNAFYGCQGNGAVSIVDIRDIAAAAVIVLAATGHEGKSYSLTGGEALTNGQVAEKISRVAGRKISYVDLPPAEFKKAILTAGMPEWSADALLDLQRLYREGKASPVSDDVERLTGRKPITLRSVCARLRLCVPERGKGGELTAKKAAPVSGLLA